MTPGRAGFLGPAGTFSQEALLASVDADAVTPVALTTIRDAVMAVQRGDVRWSLVPIENSIEGPVTVTLDTLAVDAPDVTIVAEFVLAVRQCLIARRDVQLGAITTVASHPQPAGQCARFLRERLPGAHVIAATSTAEAVRMLAEHDQEGWAALGPALAAQLYGCVVLCADVQDHDDNETRFVWLARGGDGPPPAHPGAEPSPGRKTSLVFWGPGAEDPGWLAACLGEFGQRGVNLSKIESRPRRERLGRYMFFLDTDDGASSAAMVGAIAGLRARCQEVRVLGSYGLAA